MRGGVPNHLSDLATDLLDPDVAQPSADVLAAALARLDIVPEDDLLDGEEQYNLGSTFLPGSGRLEPRRPAGRKLAIGVAGLLVIAIIGLLIGTKVLTGGDKGTAQPQASTSSGNSVTKPGGGQTKLLAVPAGQVSLVSPNGQHDKSDDVGKAVDGDSASAWSTDRYDTNSDYFTTGKKGLGILIDLGSAQSVADVQVAFTNPGATVDIRMGSSPSDGTAAGDAALIDGYTKVIEPVQVGSTHDFILPPEAASARYLLIYITVLPVSVSSSAKYQVGISEIKVSVNQ